MKFLVDADVLSEPTKPSPHAAVVGWLRDEAAEMAVSAVVLGELEFGILLLPAGRKRERLQQWFSHGVRRVRCLDFDARVATAWATLVSTLRKRGTAMSITDSMIAATAIAHGLTVVTHNETDFRKANVPLLNPFRMP